MTTEEPYHDNQSAPPLDGSTEAGYHRPSPAGRRKHQRGLPPPSDCCRPVLCLGEASAAGGLDGPAKRSQRPQEARSHGADAGRNPTPPGGSGRTNPGEPASQKRVLAVGTKARHSAQHKARLLQTITQATDYTGWQKRQLLHALGLPPATYYRWQERARTHQLSDRVVV